MRHVILAWALVMTLAALPSCREGWDTLFGPYDAQLVVIAAAPPSALRVTYDGAPARARPEGPGGAVAEFTAFPSLRSRDPAPRLVVDWDGPGGPRSLSRAMRQHDSGARCLYVLRLDAAGEPVAPVPPDDWAPFWVNCAAR